MKSRTVGLVTALACCAVTSVCSGAPLVTILYEPMTGTSRTYGVASPDHAQSANPTARHLSSPEADSLDGLTLFIVDSAGHSLTLVYGQPNAAGRAGLEEMAKRPQPPQGRVIPVLSISREVITVVDGHTGRNGSTLVYSFYPQLGALFMTQHYLDAQGENARQASMFAKCEFKWSDAK